MSQLTRTLRPLLSLLAAGILAGGISTAFAQDMSDDDRLDEAWKDAIGDQEPIMTTQQFAKLNNLAFQAAVTKVCDGYELNADKFKQAFADVMVPANTNMSDDDTKMWADAVLIRFGTTYGLFLAEGNNKPDDFCKSAADLKSSTDVPNYWQ